MCKEEINDLIWVVAAEPLDNRILRLTFNNGSVKTFDCKPLIKEQNVFGALQDEAIFRKIALDGWTVTWQNGEIDIAPEYLYENSKPTPKPYFADDDSPLPTAAEPAATCGE